MTEMLEKCFQIMEAAFQGGSNWVDSKFKAFEELILSLITDLSPWVVNVAPIPPVSVRDDNYENNGCDPARHHTFFFSLPIFVFNASQHSKQTTGPFSQTLCLILSCAHDWHYRQGCCFHWFFNDHFSSQLSAELNFQQFFFFFTFWNR